MWCEVYCDGTAIGGGDRYYLHAHNILLLVGGAVTDSSDNNDNTLS